MPGNTQTSSGYREIGIWLPGAGFGNFSAVGIAEATDLVRRLKKSDWGET